MPIGYVDSAQWQRARSWLNSLRGQLVRIEFGMCGSDLTTTDRHIELVTRLGSFLPSSVESDGEQERTLTLPDLPSGAICFWPERAILLDLAGGARGLRIVYTDGTAIRLARTNERPAS